MRRVTVLLPLLLCLTAGCGGYGASTVTTQTTTSLTTSTTAVGGTTTTPALLTHPIQSNAAFTACMKNHGYDFRAGHASVSVTPRYTAVQKTCTKLLPNGGRVPLPILTQLKGATNSYARCMRANGVPDFPEPRSSAFGVDIRVPQNFNSPEYKAAAKVCAPILEAVSAPQN